MGMSLEDVLLRSTWNPAKEIHHPEVGTLSVGAGADVAVFSVAKGKFGFTDSLGGRFDGNQKIVCELTIRSGRMQWDLNGISRAPWQERTNNPANAVWDATLPHR